MFELTPRYDSRQSFYRKAFVEISNDVIELWSYETLVCVICNGTVRIDGNTMWDSNTTLRHIKEFLKQYYEYRDWTKKDLMKYVQ